MPDAEESYVQAFDDKLSFRMLHQFLNEHKQYNKRIPHNTSLCEICENTVLSFKGIARVFHLISLPQPAFTCSKLTTETLEQGVEYVQS